MQSLMETGMIEEKNSALLICNANLTISKPQGEFELKIHLEYCIVATIKGRNALFKIFTITI